MISAKPLLSICIPTFNRASYLERCLDQIVHQEAFDSQVEVVVSDNCSEDDTKDVVERFQKTYDNIRYYRNEENLVDLNFALVFQRATGYLRKLTNDTVIYHPGAIKYMKEIAKKNLDRRPQIYFLNSGKRDDSIVITSIEDYIRSIGFLMTWTISVAVWDDDCEDLHTLSEQAHTRLGQVPFLLENFEKRGSAIISDKKIMNVQPVEKKDLTYGLYRVFYKTFLGFIKPYVDCGKISENCYEEVRKQLLLDFFCPWIVIKETRADQYKFSNEKTKELVESEYLNESYFRRYKRKLKKLRLKAAIMKIVRKN